MGFINLLLIDNFLIKKAYIFTISNRGLGEQCNIFLLKGEYNLTSRPIRSVYVLLGEIPDIEVHGYCMLERSIGALSGNRPTPTESRKANLQAALFKRFIGAVS